MVARKQAALLHTHDVMHTMWCQINDRIISTAGMRCYLTAICRLYLARQHELWHRVQYPLSPPLWISMRLIFINIGRVVRGSFCLSYCGISYLYPHNVSLLGGLSVGFPISNTDSFSGSFSPLHLYLNLQKSKNGRTSMMGPPRFELGTTRSSAERSPGLSYGPYNTLILNIPLLKLKNFLHDS